MAKKSRSFKVGYKTVNKKLAVTKKHLTEIRKHVGKKDQKDIDAQIKAMNVLLAACGNKKMSIIYPSGS